MKKLIIIGSGGYGRTVQDVATQLGYETNFLDDSIPNHPLLSFTEHIAPDTYFIPAFGNNQFRLDWCEKITAAGGQLATLIHPTAYISPTATIAPGTVVLPHAIINTNTAIKTGCIINLGAIVDHDCIIEEGVHLCLGCIVKGENRVERLSKIEAGEVIPARQWPVVAGK
jgi:UDP-N-acetylbacillosamine N-acetyltransferase